MTAVERARRLFADRFGRAPDHIARAPGRVNLIGDHTDYNDGYVLPIAVDRDVAVAFRRHSGSHVRAWSEAFGEPAEVSLSDFDQRVAGWARYVQGMAWVLRDGGHTLQGWDGAIASDVPVGGGLSSSAALELAVARVFLAAADFSAIAMAHAGQRVENDWLGVGSGIMDQYIVAAARRGHALLLDCRSLAATSVPVRRDWAVVVIDTGVSRELANSPYDDRRRECDRAAEILGVTSLRDVAPDQVEASADRLGEVLVRRARHVVTENARVLAAADALRGGDAQAMGRLMQRSHASLRDDYEASSAQLDTVVELALAHDGCYGARMTGAGWGGCAVALVDAAAADDFVETVSRRHPDRTDHQPSVFVCSAAAGVSLVSA